MELHGGIDQAVRTVVELTMVNIDETRAVNGDAISVTLFMVTVMKRGDPYHSVSRSYAVVNMKAMNDDITHTMDCDAGAVSNMNFCSTAINHVVAVH